MTAACIWCRSACAPPIRYPMQNPKKLDVMRYAHELALQCYRTTSHFPRAELVGLTNQMRRAAISIGSNIAEGCGRGTDREFRAALQHAFASASELEFQVSVSRELRFAPTEEMDALEQQVVRIKRMLSYLIAAVRRRIASETTAKKLPETRRPSPP
ncbi:MAG: four helix bundle protein [bacterium]